MNTTISPFCLDHLSNDDLLAGTRAQVGRANRVLAGMLAHLAEVDARGLYRLRACSSLSTYCVYELRMSEDAAQRRAQAAKIARRFPVLFEQIAAGHIHLTGVLMLGPHLTEANHLDVLALAKHRSKREIAGLVRRLDPLPDVPARIEPLGPAPQGNPLQSGTHAQFAAALAGPVRELPVGNRPSDWLDDFSEEAASAELVRDPDRAQATTLQPAGEEAPEDEQRDAPAPAGALLLAPQRYSVQFTAGQEYVDLLEQAKDLLAPAVSRRDLEQVHLRALRLLVAELKKRKYAVTDRSRSASRPARSKGPSAPAGVEAKQQASEGNQPPTGTPTGPKTPDETAYAVSPRQHGGSRKRAAEQAIAGPRDARAAGELGTRTIPAPVRRTVAERDQYRCTYVDDRGHRCRETSGLELHHEQAYALRGLPTTSNIALRCRPHNALAAEQDYGREFMASKLARDPRRRGASDP